MMSRCRSIGETASDWSDPNGAGKSTLFSLILGEASPDTGQITIEKSATIGFLPQETAAAKDETVLELALATTPELAEAQKVIKQHESGSGSDDASLSSRLAHFRRARRLAT